MKRVIFYFLFFVSPFVVAQAATPAVTLTDAEIAKVLERINEAEINAAQIAQKHAKNGEVVRYAKMLDKEHKKNEKETKQIANKQDIGIKGSGVEEMIKDESKVSSKNLSENKDNIDKVYLDQQIKMHEKTLAMIKDTLLPNAKNPALKDFLMKTEKSVATHLEQARELQNKFN